MALPSTIAQPNMATTPTKKTTTNLPYVQPGQQLPFSANVGSGQAFNQPGMVQPARPMVPPAPATNATVLQTAQNKSVQGIAPPTLNMTSQATQNLLADPMQGYDTGKAKQQTLEKFDLERANALKALGGQMADVSNLGSTLDIMSQQYLQGATERVNLDRQVDLDNADKKRAALISAITEGRGTSASEENRFNTELAGLTSTVGAAEGQANRDLTNDTLTSSQNFEAVQNSLNRQLQESLANGDTAKQIQILTMQQDFNKQMSEYQNQFDKTERIASQAWTSNEKVSDRDFEKSQTLLDQKFKNAQQENDIEAQKYIQDQQAKLEIAKQTNGFNDAEKKMYIQQEIDKAKSKGDFEQAQILQNQAYEFDFKKLESSQGHDVAMADLDAKLKTALANNDFANTQALELQKYANTAAEHEKDLAMDKIRVDLQAKGLDMQAWQQNYDAIMAQEEAGTAAPGAARTYLNEQLKGSGVQLEAPDPMAESKAIQEGFRVQQFQYLTTHPNQGMIVGGNQANQNLNKQILEAMGQDVSGNNPGIITATPAMIAWATVNMPEAVTLTPEASANFSAYMNQTIYGEQDFTTNFSTQGVDKALAGIGANNVGGNSVGVANVTTFESGSSGRRNVYYDKISLLSSSDLISFGDTVSRSSQYSANEKSNVATIVAQEKERRAGIIRTINSSTLTPAQKANVKSRLGLINLGW